MEMETGDTQGDEEGIQCTVLENVSCDVIKMERGMKQIMMRR